MGNAVAACAVFAATKRQTDTAAADSPARYVIAAPPAPRLDNAARSRLYREWEISEMNSMRSRVLLRGLATITCVVALTAAAPPAQPDRYNVPGQARTRTCA